MSFFARLFGSAPPKVVRHTVPHTTPGRRLVRPDSTSLAKQRGWSQNGNVWMGSFACKFGTWDGRIERRGDRFDVCIKSPPDVVKRHPRYVCFHSRRAGWQAIHLAIAPADGDVSAIIAYVERLLTDSFRLSGRS